MIPVLALDGHSNAKHDQQQLSRGSQTSVSVPGIIPKSLESLPILIALCGEGKLLVISLKSCSASSGYGGVDVPPRSLLNDAIGWASKTICMRRWLYNALMVKDSKSLRSLYVLLEFYNVE